MAKEHTGTLSEPETLGVKRVDGLPPCAPSRGDLPPTLFDPRGTSRRREAPRSRGIESTGDGGEGLGPASEGWASGGGRAGAAGPAPPSATPGAGGSGPRGGRERVSENPGRRSSGVAGPAGVEAREGGRPERRRRRGRARGAAPGRGAAGRGRGRGPTGEGGGGDAPRGVAADAVGVAPEGERGVRRQGRRRIGEGTARRALRSRRPPPDAVIDGAPARWPPGRRALRLPPGFASRGGGWRLRGHGGRDGPTARLLRPSPSFA